MISAYGLCGKQLERKKSDRISNWAVPTSIWVYVHRSNSEHLKEYIDQNQNNAICHYIEHLLKNLWKKKLQIKNIMDFIFTMDHLENIWKGVCGRHLKILCYASHTITQHRWYFVHEKSHVSKCSALFGLQMSNICAYAYTFYFFCSLRNIHGKDICTSRQSSKR